MIASTAASLVNLLGFITGVVLYVMLLWMVLSARPESNRLALLTGLLGFAWNAGGFGGYGMVNLGFTQSAPVLLAAAFSSLGFLPAVVVHSALRTAEVTRFQYLVLAAIAYAMSGIATIMNMYTAITAGTAPSQAALIGLTAGFGFLLIALLVLTRGQVKRGRVLSVVAMSVFAVSALHLSGNHAELISTLSRTLDRCETPEAALDEMAHALAPALSAKSIEWSESSEEGPPSGVQQDRRSARVTVLTTDKPHYVFSITELSGGRRLLSDDIAMLEHAALLVARRIDAVRAMRERYQRDIQEQEMRKLAAEAELRALRAQVNPHFLFNALTTIGYLIQTAPERALGTLMRRSGLLRGVLRASEEFVTIGEELDLIEAYLDIERARFEDRLRVYIDVPRQLRRIRIPALAIQPLVENAIKHGISESLAGGDVRISARLLQNELLISVIDTGPGVTESSLQRRRSRGVGLSNVEQRLRLYGNTETPLVIRSRPGAGTTVEIRLPIQAGEIASLAASAKSS